MGPATRRYVLGRLFAVLDANGSGALEREVRHRVSVCRVLRGLAWAPAGMALN